MPLVLLGQVEAMLSEVIDRGGGDLFECTNLLSY